MHFQACPVFLVVKTVLLHKDLWGVMLWRRERDSGSKSPYPTDGEQTAEKIKIALSQWLSFAALHEAAKRCHLPSSLAFCA